MADNIWNFAQPLKRKRLGNLFDTGLPRNVRPVPMPQYEPKFPIIYKDPSGNQREMSEEEYYAMKRRMAEKFQVKMKFPFTDPMGNTWTEQEWVAYQKRLAETRRRQAERMGLPEGLQLL